MKGSLHEAQDAFLGIMRKLEASDHVTLLRWIADKWRIDDLSTEAESELKEIAHCLRKRVPLMGIMPTETLYEPTDATKEEIESTVHLDEFLYDEKDLEELEADKKISRYRCCACGSRNVEQLDMISHSCSIARMVFIFRELCPDLTGKVFLDVGSRLGAVLYGAYLLTKADRIIGIEMNKDLCEITKNVLMERNMLDRVEIIHDDVLNQAQTVATADVVLVNNAFQYFTSENVAKKCWLFLKRHLKPGAVLIMSPTIDDNFSQLLGEDWRNWLSLVENDDGGLFGDDTAAYKVVST